MGGSGYISERARDRAFNLIINQEYKYLVRLVGTNEETNNPVSGGYSLFKEFNEKAMKEYAAESAKMHSVKVSKIEVWTLDAEKIKEIEL